MTHSRARKKADQARKKADQAENNIIMACICSPCQLWKDPEGGEMRCRNCPIRHARDFIEERRKELETDDTLD